MNTIDRRDIIGSIRHLLWECGVTSDFMTSLMGREGSREITVTIICGDEKYPFMLDEAMFDCRQFAQLHTFIGYHALMAAVKLGLLKPATPAFAPSPLPAT
jgi:hypothetical protein